MEIPELALAAGHGPHDIGTFVSELIALADRLPGVQQRVMADPGILPDLERRLERDIITLILGHFGPVTILAEEHFNTFGTYAHTAPDGPAGLSFVLDPLDGSKSFTTGSDNYSVSVAACAGLRPVLGLVYQPSTQKLYSAAINAGAYINASPVISPQQAMARLVAVPSEIFDGPSFQVLLRNLRAESYDIERMECTSLKFCWLAEGLRAGLLKRLSVRNGLLCTWGTAAGQLVATEAGVGCRRLDGTPWEWAAGIVAAGDRDFLADLLSHGDRHPKPTPPP